MLRTHGMGIPDDVLIAALYWRIKRSPEEGTLAPAIRAHAQACGLIAYLFDIHPDEVARHVAQANFPKPVEA